MTAAPHAEIPLEAIQYENVRGGGEIVGPEPIDLDDLSSAVFPEPEHKIAQLLPEKAVTLLGGHGGAGKSMLALLLAVRLATGRDFMGKAVKRSRVIFYSCEDGADIIKFRLSRICAHLGIDAAELRGWLRVYDMTGVEPVLYREEHARGVVTDRYYWLQERFEEFDGDVLMVDNASDVYDASEISRPRVRHFIRALGRIVRPRGGALLLLAHVDKATARAGSGSEGYSGSTAWHNSVRSRMYLYEEGGRLVLDHQKANYGKTADKMFLVREGGALLEGGADTKAQPIIAYQRLRAVLRLIRDFNDRGEVISTATSGPGNTHHTLHAEAGYPEGLSRDDLVTLLREAERQKLIERVERKTGGRRAGEQWTLTTKGRGECEAYAPQIDGANAA